jgi:hypothetical protein
MGPQEEEEIYWDMKEHALEKSLSEMESARIESQKMWMNLDIEGQTLVKNVSNVVSVGKYTPKNLNLLYIKEHTQEKGLSDVKCVGNHLFRVNI